MKTTSASRSNKFDVLELIEGEQEVEGKRVVEITVDSGADKSVSSIRKKRGARKKGDEDGKVGGSKRRSDENEARKEDSVVKLSEGFGRPSL